jgi:hypothetical protein
MSGIIPARAASGGCRLEERMRYLFGILAAGLLCTAIPIAHAKISPDKVLTGSGLICDTKEQAERFVSLMSGDFDKTLLAVNREAGDAHACVIATLGFIPGEKVAEVDKEGTIMHVIEIKVVAVATRIGLHFVEPKTYYSVIASKGRSV